eukprot:69312-Rhodomonas_salina.6
MLYQALSGDTAGLQYALKIELMPDHVSTPTAAVLATGIHVITTGYAAIGLRACYANSGTDLAYAATRCPGTDLAYAATPTVVAATTLPGERRYGLCVCCYAHFRADLDIEPYAVRYDSILYGVICLRTWNAITGTDLRYGATANFVAISPTTPLAISAIPVPPPTLCLLSHYTISAVIVHNVRYHPTRNPDEYDSNVATARCTALSAYARAMRCPAISGTGLAHAAVVLRVCYAMSGTDLGYAATAIRTAYPSLRPL